MTTTQTRTAATAIATLIVLGLLIVTPAGAYIVHNFCEPIAESLRVMFGWLFGETLDAAGRTIGGLLGEFGELWDSIFG